MSNLRIASFLRGWRKLLQTDASLLRGPHGVDRVWYRNTYTDLGEQVNPIDHYAAQGWREGKDPNPNFSTTWYLAQYPDVAAAGTNPLLHYLRHGRAERRRMKLLRESEPPAA